MTDNVVGEQQLLPCPFCGAAGKVFGDAYQGFTVECSGATCKVSPASSLNHPLKYSIKEWNTRAVPSPSVAQDLIDNNKPLDPAIAAALNEDFLKLYEPIDASPSVAIEDEARRTRHEAANIVHHIQVETGQLRQVLWEGIAIDIITAALERERATVPLPLVDESANRIARAIVSDFVKQSSPTDHEQQVNAVLALIDRITSALSAQHEVGLREALEIAEGYQDSIGNTAANICAALRSKLKE